MTKWTREVPVKLGWYWWRNYDSPDDIYHVQPVLVDEWILRTAEDGGEYWPIEIITPPGTKPPYKEPK